jgi:hypothetical protein
VKNHWNSTLKRRRHEFAPGGVHDVSALTALLRQKLTRVEGECALNLERTSSNSNSRLLASSRPHLLFNCC